MPEKELRTISFASAKTALLIGREQRIITNYRRIKTKDKDGERNMLEKKIVLLTDPTRKIESASISRHDMEGYTPLELQKIEEAIETFARCELYTDPADFIENISAYKRDLVFPMVWGRGGRNTKAILPAVCEAEQIDYIGADAYTQALCYDKYLSKKYAETFGFKTPQGFMLFKAQSDEDIRRLLRYIKLPLIVKPNFGGGSCGISNSNLVDTYEDAFALAKVLFGNGYNPLLAEEYVAGQEISILLLGNHNKVRYSGETQLILEGDTYFTHRIWGFETKKLEFQKASYQVCETLPTAEHSRAKELFLSLPKAEYLRVDGRFNENGFFVLELSADCYLGPNGDFSTLFESNGKSHADLLRFLAENAILSQSGGDSPIA